VAEMIYVFDKSEALSHIAEVYVKAGEFEKALEVIEKALEVTKWIGYSYLKSKALSHIAIACAEAGEFEKALEVAKEIESES